MQQFKIGDTVYLKCDVEQHYWEATRMTVTAIHKSTEMAVVSWLDANCAYQVATLPFQVLVVPDDDILGGWEQSQIH